MVIRMKLDIPNISKIVEVNSLVEVKDPLLLDKDGKPNEAGLYSYSIFGRQGSKERKQTFAYIDLGRKYFHPVVYRMLIEMDRSIGDIISGARAVKLNASGFIVDDENGETGIDFFVNNWKKFKIDDKDGKSRKEKIDLLQSLEEDRVFITKWLVAPAFYRDLTVGSDGRISSEETTSMYSKLIGLTARAGDDLQLFSGNITHSRVQALLYEIYELFTGRLAKKNGVIHKGLLGKSVDYAVRGVISGPSLTSPTFRDQQVPYGYIGLPLYMAMSAFLPLILNELSNFFQPMRNASILSLAERGGKMEKLIDATADSISPDKLTKLIKMYSMSHDDRLAPFKVKVDSGEKPLKLFEDELGRPFTLTDLFFIITSRVVRDKYVVATRYPLEDYRNIAPMKVKILTTEKTGKMKFGNFEYEDYPHLEGKHIRWIDSIRPNNSYLEGWGGDYDGDMISVKALFTQEANEELETIANQPMTLLSGSGSASRVLGKEGILTLYSMTK